MPKTYKNNAGHTILGIEPGQTGELDDATGYVGPDALEAVGGNKPESKSGGVLPRGVADMGPEVLLPPEVKSDADGD